MLWRASLLAIQALVTLTSAAGGLALTFGPSLGSLGIRPPLEYLEGSPFDSYLVPGLILLVVISGTHLLAWVLLLRRNRWALAASAVAGCGILVWIFVQMVVIPFSILQAVYFGAGLLELVLVMLLLGILDPQPADSRTARGQAS